MSKFAPVSKKEENSSSSYSLLSKRCRRFNAFDPFQTDSARGIIYLKLRNIGCKKKEALNYCSKNICRVDSTRMTDGPPEHRILKVKEKASLTQNGWQFQDLVYKLGKNFYTKADEILQMDDQDELLLKNFIASEERSKEEFKKKIRRLSEFYEELNRKYDFTNLEKKDLFWKAKKLNQTTMMNGENREKSYYIPCNDLKFRTLVEDALFSENLSPSLVKQMQIFPKYHLCQINPENMGYHEYENFFGKMEEEDEEEGEEEEEVGKKDEEQKKKNIGKRNSSFLQLKAASTFLGKAKRKLHVPNVGKNKIDLKKLKEKSDLFLNLEAQNKYINEITNDDSLPPPPGATLLPGEESRKSQKLEILALKNFAASISIADEFNRANYMYPVRIIESNEETRKLIPYSVQEKSDKNHFRRLKSIRMGLSAELKSNKEGNGGGKLMKEGEKIRIDEVSSNRTPSQRSPISSLFPVRSSITFTPNSLSSRKQAGGSGVKQGMREIVERKGKKEKDVMTTSTLFRNLRYRESHNIEPSKVCKGKKVSIFINEGELDPQKREEIKQELDFQNDLKNFVKRNISSCNMLPPASLRVDTSRVEEFMTQIQDLRMKDSFFLRHKGSAPTLANTENFFKKKGGKSKFQNFFKTANNFNKFNKDN